MTQAQQQSFFDDSPKNQGPVECLGLTFENDEARRAHFTERLRRKLQDPEFRQIEGFPIGEDEDILALSDPPYYTACPNPFIEDFIKHYGKPYDPKNDNYRREPFAVELAESRNNPFVNAHSYATKVPHQAVMRLLLHYTEPADLVLDAFGGTGMAAVAAQLCADPDQRFRETVINDMPDVKWGTRFAIVGDLSPAATFIARNFNLPDDLDLFAEETQQLAEEVEAQCGWMYETYHSNGQIGNIIVTLWSDVFTCPDCGAEIVFWDGAVNLKWGKIEDKVICQQCGAKSPKTYLERAWTAKFDPALGQTIRSAKQTPILIVYEYGGKRYEKLPDDRDLKCLDQIEREDIPCWFPTERMPIGEESRRNDDIGITHVHQFFTKRNLHTLAFAWSKAKNARVKFMLTSLMYKSSLLCAPLMSNYFASRQGRSGGGWVGKERSGTLYYPSIHSEVAIVPQIKTRSKAVRISAASSTLPCITTGSATELHISDNTIDYIFTDPPFGANRMYSELNFLWEAWLRIFTNSKPEAIQNKAQKKGLQEYEALMTRSFREYYRVLKPGRWISVEFSNTKAAVWNALQTSLGAVGFVVADVRSLDKQQGSIAGYTTSTAVRQDLAISAYKPNGGLEERFKLKAGSEEGAWEFIRTHLRQLPIFVGKVEQVEIIVERMSFLLFDRMVAFHVQRGVTVPLSAAEFHAGLAQRFPERDGMYFLPDQVAEYDKKRMTVKEVLQLQLFVTDESSAIQWLKQQLTKKPQTFQEIHPQFMKEIAGWQKYEKNLELTELLEQNFLRYNGQGPIPEQIWSWLQKSSTSREQMEGQTRDTADATLRTRAKDRWYVPDPTKAGDLEKLREKALLKEFEEYRESKQKRLKVFRLEAVRAGFKKAWQERDYATIIQVADKIPDNVLQEDPKLLMWYDQAVTRSGM